MKDRITSLFKNLFSINLKRTALVTAFFSSLSSFHPLAWNGSFLDRLTGKSCTLEVTLEGAPEYFEELWNYQLIFKNDTVSRMEILRSIKLSPAVEFKESSISEQGNVMLPMNAWNFSGGKDYEIRIDSLLGEKGCSLSAPLKFAVHIPDRKPYFSMDHYYNVIESGMKQILPVEISNIPEMDLGIAQLDLSSLQKALEKGKNQYQNEVKGLSFVSKKWKTGVQKNGYGRVGLDFSSYLSADKKGWLAVKLGAEETVGNYDYTNSKYTYKPQYTERTMFVQSTDLGITSRTDGDVTHIWVHSIGKALPVSGAELTLYGGKRSFGKCTTDKDGYCEIGSGTTDAKMDSAFIHAVHKASNDSAYMVLSDSKRDYAYGVKEALNAAYFFDRKLYRPGEEVSFKVLLSYRKKGEIEPFSGKNITFTVTDSRGQNVLSKTAVTSSEGGADGSYKIPEGAALGHYKVSVKAGAMNETGSDTFQVEEFRPVTFSVNLEAPKTGKAGESLNVSMIGKYLFGAPMSGAKAEYSVQRFSSDISFPEYSDYTFLDGWTFEYYERFSEENGGYYTNGQGELDAAGRYSFALNLDASGQTVELSDGTKLNLPKPYRLKVEATVKDVDDRSVTNTESILVSPSDTAIGIRSNDYYRHKDKAFEFDLIALKMNGDKLKGKSAEVYVYKKEWNSVRTGSSGGYSVRNDLQNVLKETKKVQLSSSPLKFSFKAEDSGSYTIIVQEKEGNGFAMADFYAYGGKQFVAWDFRSDDSLEIKSDKKTYKPGDKAKIMIKSPFAKARAVVTLEREKVFFRKVMNIEGNSEPIEIPVLKEYLPNVHVSVMLFKPRTSPPEGKDISKEDREEFLKEDYGIPAFKSGTLSLTVDTSEKKARLEIVSEKKEYSPGDRVKIKIRTEPNAEVALSVADRAVLDIVGYSYSSPLGLFYSHWSNSFSAYDMRGSLIRQYIYQQKGDGPGGGDGDTDQKPGSGGFGQDSEDGVRKNFRMTAYWNPKLKADDNGNLNVEFDLPDNLTSFKMMAVVSSKGKYGAENREFTVKKPVTLQKLVPRFVRLNDTVEIGAVAVNTTGIEGKFRFRLSSDSLTVGNGGTKDVLLPKQGSVEISFPVKIGETEYKKLKNIADRGYGRMEARAVISADPLNPEAYEKAGFTEAKLKDRMELKFPVKEGELMTSFALSGMTEEKASFDVPFPKKEEILFNTGKLNVSLSNTALFGLNKAFRFFQSNPYFCMEQRTSAYLLSITSGELLKEFSFTPPDDKSYNFTNIDGLFNGEMNDFQNEDGSFRLWKPSGSSSYPYLTAYAASVMSLAKEKKYSINTAAFDKALGYLRGYISNPKEKKENALETLSLIYYIFMKEGIQDDSLEKTLTDSFDKMRFKGKAMFVLGLAHKKGLEDYRQESAVRRFYESLLSSVKFEKETVSIVSAERNRFWFSYDSESMDLAYLLRIMIRLDSSNENIYKLVQFLLAHKKGESFWMDSHSAGNLALAFQEYRDQFEKNGNPEYNAKIMFHNALLAQKIFRSDSPSNEKKEFSFASLNLNGKSGKIPAVISKDSAGSRLYYSALLEYLPVKPDWKERSSGLKIEKEVLKVVTDGKNTSYEKTGANLKRGETYLVKLKVTSEGPVSHLMISDPLPAFMEVINTAFATEKKSLEDVKNANSGTASEWWENSPEYAEYRDDRVLIALDYFKGGERTFSYLARPIVKGQSGSPPAKAFLMYDPVKFGYSNGISLKAE